MHGSGDTCTGARQSGNMTHTWVKPLTGVVCGGVDLFVYEGFTRAFI